MNPINMSSSSPSSSFKLQQISTRLNEYHQLIKTCIRNRDLAGGQRLHLRLLQSNLPISPVLSSLFMSFYSQCNRPDLARQVFDEMPQPRDIASWNTIISCFAKNNDPAQSIASFHDLLLDTDDSGLSPNEFTISTVLSACTALGSLPLGQQVHSMAIKIGCTSDVIVANNIASLYGKHGMGALHDSRKVFDRMPVKDLVSWNTMITRYVENGFPKEAMELFEQMRIEGTEPNEFVTVSVMSACIALGSLRLGRELHSLAIRKGLVSSTVVVGGNIANMYGKCGMAPEDSRKVFDTMVERNVVVWNSMITRYVEYGSMKDAMDLFEEMMVQGFEPNEFTIIAVMSACIALGSLRLGQQLHSLATKIGSTSNVMVGNSIANMYGTCGMGGVDDLRKYFDRMVERDVGSWNLMITRYAEHGLAKEAMDLFEQTRMEGFEPDEFTVTSVISACVALRSLQLGRQLHSLAITKGFVSNVSIAKCITNMYAKLQSVGGLKKG